MGRDRLQIRPSQRLPGRGNGDVVQRGPNPTRCSWSHRAPWLLHGHDPPLESIGSLRGLADLREQQVQVASPPSALGGLWAQMDDVSRSASLSTSFPSRETCAGRLAWSFSRTATSDPSLLRVARFSNRYLGAADPSRPRKETTTQTTAWSRRAVPRPRDPHVSTRRDGFCRLPARQLTWPAP